MADGGTAAERAVQSAQKAAAARRRMAARMVRARVDVLRVELRHLADCCERPEDAAMAQAVAQGLDKYAGRFAALAEGGSND